MKTSGSTSASDALLPENWREFAPLVDAVLDAPIERRTAVLDEVSGGDLSKRATLLRLVVECEREMPLLDRPAAERFASLLDAPVERPLPEVLGGRYRIEREVGRGGMARVYLAHDGKHARDVAVKVIRPELAASLGSERFLREIAIAARLRHPNIVPLYDSGDADGVLYFVMPYEEGPSLRTRLREGGPVPTGEALGILRDVARALAYAHEHGVVHRDVKPDNVLLSGGAAVVADFGIAKAVSAAQGDVAGTPQQSGAVIGTPSYMAPEQALGDPATDHRADLYSFGRLANELLGARRADVPDAVTALVARCLEIDPAARPQSARALLTALDATELAEARVSPASGAAWPRTRIARWVGLALAAGAIGTATYVATRAPVPAAPLTLAVLPFTSIGADTSIDYVAQGLSDEVAGALERIPGIQIRSRTAARAYRGRPEVDVATAGAALKAAYLMTGVVRRQSGHWVLSLDLSRASDATSVWTDSFGVGPDEQAVAAETIASRMAAALRNRFPGTIGAVPAFGSNQRTRNNEAYRLYLQGQRALDRRGQTVVESAELFRRAIHEDTLFAPAYSGLSVALSLAPFHDGVAARGVHDDIVHAARRALVLDSTLAQPHIALGEAYELEYQWDSAATEFQTAVRLDPHLIEARHQYARHLRNRGRLAEAMRQLRVARAEDPSSAVVLSHMAYLYYLNHQPDSALVESRRALQNDSTNRTTLALGALIRLANGMPGEARTLIDRAPATSPYVTYVIAKSGDTAAARRRLREQDAQRPQPAFAETRRAFTYLGLGDTAQALSALERATDAKEIWPIAGSYLDPIQDPIRQSARFKALLRRLRLEP